MSGSSPSATPDDAFQDVDSESIHHVYPTFGREHVTDQRDQCWCHPSVEYFDDIAIVVHGVEQ